MGSCATASGIQRITPVYPEAIAAAVAEGIASYVAAGIASEYSSACERGSILIGLLADNPYGPRR